MIRSKLSMALLILCLGVTGWTNAQDIDHLIKNLDGLIQKQQKQMEKQMNEMEKQMDSIHISPSQLAFDFEMPKLPKLNGFPQIPPLDRLFNEFTGVKVSEVVEKTWKVEREKPLHLFGTFSEIAVVPGNVTDEINASIEMIAGSGNEEKAKTILETMKVNFDDSKDHYQISVPRVDNKNHKVGDVRVYKVKLRIPKKLSALEIDNTFGEILVNDVETEIICKNEFGSIKMDNVRGNANIQNKFGPLEIHNHTGDGEYHIEFGGLTIKNYDGDLKLNVKFSQTDISGLNEDVTLAGNFSFGAVTIHLPEDFSGMIDAQANMGQIEAPAALHQQKEMMEQKVQGTIGDGKGRIKIDAEFSPVSIKMGNGGERKEEIKQPPVVCKGVVRDAETLKPIPQAKVVAYYLNQEPYAEVMTDDSGHYEFKIHSEEHLLKASAPGYEDDKNVVDTGFLQRKKNLSIDFVLDPK